MTPEEYERAGRIFREARSLGEDERAAFLDRACGGDAALRAAVEAWLAADESTGELGVARADGGGDAAELPDRIGEFEVLGLLGRGGMGRVYLARQRTPARRVALKTLDPESPLSRTSIARFEAEAEYLARLHHDGIAQVYATGREETEHGRLPYLVMEWVEDGRALTAYAEAAGLGLEERLSLFLQLCDAVTHAHRRGVLHRDLKPSNVLVTPDGRLKVLDFGVARALEPAAAAAGELTRRGEAIGTLPYMSPEQAQGRTEEIDVRTDVYALGVILFELVAGRLPFALPADRYDAVEMISTQLPPRLNAVRPDVPRDLAAVVDAALAKAKDRRYESVAAFADDVRCVVEGKPVSTRPVSTWERGVYLVRRRKATAAAVTFLVLGLVGTSSFGVRSWLLDREAFFSEKKAEASE
ncbi:MAG: serine/threonine-protein kinase, partial [Planctomycetota bacterium JB042]